MKLCLPPLLSLALSVTIVKLVTPISKRRASALFVGQVAERVLLFLRSVVHLSCETFLCVAGHVELVTTCKMLKS